MMSLGKEASPMNSQCSSADVADQFLSTDWNPVVLMDQNSDFNRASGLSSYNVMVPMSQGKSNTNTLSKQFQSAIDPLDFPLNSKHGNEKNLKGKKRKSVHDSSALHPDFPMEMSPNVEIEHQINVLPESNTQDEKKHESAITAGVNHKPTAKHVEECSQGGDAPKEDYIHIRAKRGQATNSHSLAERVRREKISERMKLLQDLVPGCNKINGKAMMLDEIINYVQSLQRQVEFLSMKLSTVNPELPFDIEQIFSKDILHSRGGGLAVFGCGPARSASGPHFPPQFPPQGFMQQEFVMCNMPNVGDMMRPTFPQVSNMTQLSGVWDDELQTALQMGFIPNPPLTISDPNGTMKTDE